jgi:hypothetical protein
MTLDCPDLSFINHYSNNSLLKKRITTLQKQETNSRLCYKFLWMIPVILSSLLYTACTQDLEEKKSDVEVFEIISLKDFQKGQVNYYKGLTDEEINLYESHLDYVNQNPNFDSNFYTSIKGQSFLLVAFKIIRNGTT